MPKSMKKRPVSSISEVTEENVNKEIIEESEPVKEVVVKEKRIFKNDDLIPCRSITNGELLMVGNKTNILYRWADYDDVAEVEYQDLIYEARVSRSSFVSYPRFIILDEDFVEQNRQVAEIYEKMYTVKDLRNILNMSPMEMRNIIPSLPQGAKESIKGLAATMIHNGQLDSVKKIKVLDELFDTDMMKILSEE